MLYPTELRAPAGRSGRRRGRARALRFTGSISLILLILACRDQARASRITRLETYRCGSPELASCTDMARGARIPLESLPPVNQAFQVWAYHPGGGKVVYRLEWESPFFVGDTGASLAAKSNENVFDAAKDSSMLSYNFVAAARARYTLRVQLETRRGRILDEDTLVWDFSGFPPGPAAPEEHLDEQETR